MKENKSLTTLAMRRCAHIGVRRFYFAGGSYLKMLIKMEITANRAMPDIKK